MESQKERKVMQRSKLAIALMFIVILFSFTSAGFISKFGKLIGEVEVDSPILYLDSYDVMNDASGYLKVNDNDVNMSYFELDSMEFFSPEINLTGIFPFEFETQLNLQIKDLPRNETTGEILESGSIFISVFRTNENGRIEEQLCSTILIGINNEDDFDEYEFICHVYQDVDFEENNRIKLLVNDGSPSVSHINVKYDNSHMKIIEK